MVGRDKVMVLRREKCWEYKVQGNSANTRGQFFGGTETREDTMIKLAP